MRAHACVRACVCLKVFASKAALCVDPRRFGMSRDKNNIAREAFVLNEPLDMINVLFIVFYLVALII